MSGRKIGTTLAIALFATATGASAATITTYTDRASFAAAAGTTATETFNSYVNDVSFGASSISVGPMTLSASLASGSANLIDVPPFTTNEANVDGTPSLNVLTLNGTTPGTMTITFSSPITAFGADFSQFNDEIPRTQIVIDLVSTLSPPTTTGQTSFFGFVSDTAFTTVTFVAAFDADAFGIDNVTYSTATTAPTPEPATLALLGAGLAGLGALRRKRKAA